ncbi:hypothetical protein [Rhizobium sp. LEGMi135b]
MTFHDQSGCSSALAFDHGCTGTDAKADGERPDHSGLFVFGDGALLAKAERAIFIFCIDHVAKEKPPQMPAAVFSRQAMHLPGRRYR